MDKEYKTIDIHGKQYMPVSERVRMAHDSKKFYSLETEVLQHNPVVIRAVVTLVNQAKMEDGKLAPIKQIFTGISAANPGKAIEKQSPYEVAETSAVGRALGFAGFGIMEGIASADEMFKAQKSGPIKPKEGKLDLPDEVPFP